MRKQNLIEKRDEWVTAFRQSIIKQGRRSLCSQRCFNALRRQSHSSCEGLDSGNVSTENQVVNVMSSFVGFDRFEVCHVSHDWVFVEDTICPVDVTSNTSNLQRNIDIVHLGKRDLFVEPGAFILLSPEMVGQKLSLGDLPEHPRKFVLDQLVRGDWMIELNSRK